MKIFATKERQDILDGYGIKYKIDYELNFHFDKTSDEERAIKVLRGHLAL